MEKRNRKLVEILGCLEWIDILDKKQLLKMNVRYIGTDFQTNVDIYEDCLTGKLLGKID